MFRKAAVATVADVLYDQASVPRLKAAIAQARAEDRVFRGNDAHWRALDARVATVVANLRSDASRPYEPDHFICPITLQLMTQPVTSKYGTSYEQDAIQAHIALTGADEHGRPLAASDLVASRNLREAIRYYRLHELRLAIPVKQQCCCLTPGGPPEEGPLSGRRAGC